jgi:UDPglucose 6-dehydrogenase
VGTGEKCEERIAATLKKRGMNFAIPVISNPEFLREGLAVNDTLMPERIVVGINSLSPTSPPLGEGQGVGARSLMEELYRPITRVGKPLVFMSRESAEIVKYASNAFLATKISFINMLTELCEKTGANIRDVAGGMGLDSRIGPRFLHAGIGYGGSCFPKDVKALLALAKEEGLDFGIVEATDRINAAQRKRFFDQIIKMLPPKATIAIWGLAFKPKTDDMREAPSLDVIALLLERGYTVRAFDPEAMKNAKKCFDSPSKRGRAGAQHDKAKLEFAHSPMDAAKNADAVVLLTEWDIFRGIDLKELKKIMKGNAVFDGRNVYEPHEVTNVGLSYHGIGIGKVY